MTTVTIFGIFLGKYARFFDKFLSSCSQHFLTDTEKQFIIFTDAPLPVPPEYAGRVTLIPETKLGWPFDSMMRFHMFNRVLDRWHKSSDYCFFINANADFVSNVGSETLPQNDWEIVCVSHPAFYAADNEVFPYERNPESNFCIPNGEGSVYVQGCYIGGTTTAFSKMSLTLAPKIDEDVAKGIIPIWHDESALNWYIQTTPIHLMHPGHAYPESRRIPFDKKIVMIDKNRFGGYNYLRS